jgi:hypothetical protein
MDLTAPDWWRSGTSRAAVEEVQSTITDEQITFNLCCLPSAVMGYRPEGEGEH